MWEAIVGFGLGVVTSVWALVVLLCFAVFCEYDSKDTRSGWSEFWAICAIFITLFVYDFGWQVYAIVAAVWFPIGFLWALLKWKFRKDQVQRVWKENQPLTSDSLNQMGTFQLQDMLKRVTVSKNKSLITHWVIMWPVSMFTTLTFDIYETVKFLVTVKFVGVFERISGDLQSEISEEVEKVTKNNFSR